MDMVVDDSGVVRCRQRPKDRVLYNVFRTNLSRLALLDFVREGAISRDSPMLGVEHEWNEVDAGS